MAFEIKVKEGRSVRIIDGPSKEEFFNSLEAGSNAKRVYFKDEYGYSYVAIVRGALTQEETRASWWFLAVVETISDGQTFIEPLPWLRPTFCIEGCFNVVNRKGWFQLSD